MQQPQYGGGGGGGGGAGGGRPGVGNQQQQYYHGQHKQVNPQVMQRQRLVQSLFGGGPANRYLLSLRSGIPTDVDFALEVFAQYSFSDAQTIPLETLHGLATALLDLVRPSGQQQQHDEETRRRALEAALVLRNLVIEGGQRGINAVRTAGEYIFTVLVEVLALDGTSVDRPSADAELKIYLLDVAEVFAPYFTLSLPPPSATSASVDLAQEAMSGWATDQQLLPRLAHLAVQSNDRAIIISAYTVLGALALNDRNEPVFAYQAASTPSTSSGAEDLASPPSPLQDPSGALFHRSLQLLPVNDVDLLQPVFEFLYQHTLIPANASIALLRSDLRDILRTIALRIKEGSVDEVMEYEVKNRPELADENLRGRLLRETLIKLYPILSGAPPPPGEQAEPRVDEETTKRLALLPEPERATQWMQIIFEADPEGEITQVALWKAYQKQFDAYDPQMRTGEIPAMLSASEVIRLCSEIIPGASPSALGDDLTGKRYLIAGVAIKTEFASLDPQRLALRQRWACHWEGCTDTRRCTSGNMLYQHVRQDHVQFQYSDAPVCLFGKCGLRFADQRELLYHLRTHIVAASPANPTGPTTTVLAADSLDSANRNFSDKNVHAQTTNGEFAVGIGFVASLVLRNLARAIASGATRYRKRVHQHGGSVNGGMLNSSDKLYPRTHRSRNSIQGVPQPHLEDGAEEERRRMLGFLSGQPVDAEDEEGSSDLPREVSLNGEQVNRAVSALVALQRDVVALAAYNGPLAPYLLETLECIDTASRAL